MSLRGPGPSYTAAAILVFAAVVDALTLENLYLFVTLLAAATGTAILAHQRHREERLRRPD